MTPEQGSQQLQGEVLELELEGLLTTSFPLDGVEAVRKGVRGADVIQTVKTRSGLAMFGIGPAQCASLGDCEGLISS